ncbi:MAG: ASKHA domain-containing protein [Oscillospiraceae bacterium]
MISVKLQDGSCRSFDSPEKPVTAMKFLAEHNIGTDSPCGGAGKCGKCRAKIFGDILPPGETELGFLTPEDISGGVRLLCLTYLSGGDAEIALLSQNEVSGITESISLDIPLSPWGQGLGLAVDIGTTTVAGYLYDLGSGNRLSESAAQNPQCAFGADVISRLSHSLAGNGGKLRDSVTSSVASLAEILCQKAGRSTGDIGAAVITGNTSMLYLFHGYDVSDLARAPFKAGHLFGTFEPADCFFSGWAPGSRIYFAPCISAYIGADLVCAVLASGMCTSGTPSLLADIGTNGEIALYSGGRLLCCSTAAGPAFEGAGISQGSGAFAGAIDRVYTECGTLRVHSIGGEKPRSICGSGLLDAAAALLKTGLMDETGRLTASEIRLGESDVLLTQADIRAFQLAKAAIRAGMETLLHHAKPGSLPRLLMAGGFGTKLSPESAATTGLIIPGMEKNCLSLGNAAGLGACAMLLSEDCVGSGENIAKTAGMLELTADPFFADSYIENMVFE